MHITHICTYILAHYTCTPKQEETTHTVSPYHEYACMHRCVYTYTLHTYISYTYMCMYISIYVYIYTYRHAGIQCTYATTRASLSLFTCSSCFLLWLLYIVCLQHYLYTPIGFTESLLPLGLQSIDASSYNGNSFANIRAPVNACIYMYTLSTYICIYA